MTVRLEFAVTHGSPHIGSFDALQMYLIVCRGCPASARHTRGGGRQHSILTLQPATIRSNYIHYEFDIPQDDKAQKADVVVHHNSVCKAQILI
jgi:hypothetical protein